MSESEKEKLINKFAKFLISVQFPIKDKEEIINTTAEFALAILQEEYDIEYKDRIKIELDDYDYTKGEFSNNNMSIGLNESIFEDEEEFINNIATILHEFRHFAQTQKRKDGDDSTGMPKIIAPNADTLVYGLVYHSLSQSENKILDGDFEDDTSLEERTELINRVEKRRRNIYDKYVSIFIAPYYLRSYELDARGFSYSILEEVLANINIAALNEQERKIYEERVEQLNSMIEEENQIVQASLSSKQIPIETVKTPIIELRQDILTEKISLGDEKLCLYDFVRKPNIGNASLAVQLGCDEKGSMKTITESLRYVYDDKLAHEHFGVLIDAYPNMRNYMYNNLLSLYRFTDIQLSPKEKSSFLKIIEDQNKSSDSNKSAEETYEQLTQQKQAYASSPDRFIANIPER